MGHPPHAADGFGAVISKYMADTYKAGVAALLAQGGRPIAAASYRPDGAVRDNSRSLIEPLYREIAEKQPYLEDASPIPYARYNQKLWMRG